jgi:hypothetical protein
MAQTPETSEYTSIKDHVEKLKWFTDAPNKNPEQPTNLLPFVGNYRDEMPKGLPFDLKDYLQLADWTGRAILENKQGLIPDNLPPHSRSFSN